MISKVEMMLQKLGVADEKPLEDMYVRELLKELANLTQDSQDQAARAFSTQDMLYVSEMLSAEGCQSVVDFI